ncbi:MULTISPECIES: hypothetical protein [unclassified Bifidobacterium]|uniref:hypothetical protein n=1 Tax=unclassified Bifidobacterium TaxID=2608897 RepID=UPI00226AE764|nr:MULTISPECIES: hypothetical protein [unclassified Bifidobacterium]
MPVTVVNSAYGGIFAVRAGAVAQLTINWRSANGDSWDSGGMGHLPDDWRPAMTVIHPYQGRDGSSQRQITIDTNGAISYQNFGNSQNTGGFSTSLTYLLA